MERTKYTPKRLLSLLLALIMLFGMFPTAALAADSETLDISEAKVKYTVVTDPLPVVPRGQQNGSTLTVKIEVLYNATMSNRDFPVQLKAPDGTLLLDSRIKDVFATASGINKYGDLGGFQFDSALAGGKGGFYRYITIPAIGGTNSYHIWARSTSGLGATEHIAESEWSITVPTKPTLDLQTSGPTANVGEKFTASVTTNHIDGTVKFIYNGQEVDVAVENKGTVGFASTMFTAVENAQQVEAIQSCDCGVDTADAKKTITVSRPVPDTATVSFYNDTTLIGTKIVEKGKCVDPVYGPVVPGYVLEGWYKDAGLIQRFDFSEVVNNDFPLYAKMIENETAVKTFDVTFYMNDGTDTVFSTIPVFKGSGTANPGEPTRDGFVFKGWYNAPACADGDEYNFGAAMTAAKSAYAKWEAVTVETTYTVTFDVGVANAGPVPGTQVVKKDDAAIEPTTEPTRDGYAFAGWYLVQADGSLANSAYVFTTPVTGNITLRAK